MISAAVMKEKLKAMEEDPRLDPFNIVLARQKARAAIRSGQEKTKGKVGLATEIHLHIAVTLSLHNI